MFFRPEKFDKTKAIERENEIKDMDMDESGYYFGDRDLPKGTFDETLEDSEITRKIIKMAKILEVVSLIIGVVIVVILILGMI